jgi:hypothetical protein
MPELKTFCSVCQRCLAAQDAKMCSICKIARYCSRECQKEVWPTHKASCKKLDGAQEKNRRVCQKVVSCLFRVLKDDEFCQILSASLASVHPPKRLCIVYIADEKKTKKEITQYLKWSIKHYNDVKDLVKTCIVADGSKDVMEIKEVDVNDRSKPGAMLVCSRINNSGPPYIATLIY